jgi:hypothetical protein
VVVAVFFFGAVVVGTGRRLCMVAIVGGQEGYNLLSCSWPPRVGNAALLVFPPKATALLGPKEKKKKKRKQT